MFGISTLILLTAAARWAAGQQPEPVKGVQWGSTAGPLTRSIPPRTSWVPQRNAITPAGVSAGSDFDGGNGYVLGVGPAEGGVTIDMAIVPDPFSERDNKTFVGRFLVRLTNVDNNNVTINIVNAGDVNVASNDNTTRWQTYTAPWQARASYNFEDWFLVPTEFEDNKTLVIRHSPTADVVWYAYFPPYPLSRLEAAVGSWGELPPRALADLTAIGQSILGQDLFLLTIGENCEGKTKFWVTGGIHPSETQGIYFVEGLADAATDGLITGDDDAESFFDEACLLLVPASNPDGQLLGHHRTSALGNNLNRVWDIATPDTAPEILAIQGAMLERGVDFYLDAHADEDNEGHFVFYAQGICNQTSGGVWNTTFDDVKDALEAALKAVNPEYTGIVPEGGAYDPDPPCAADNRFSDNWTGSHFGVVAGTLEMPFKDVANNTDEQTGYSPDRAYMFGRAAFQALQMVLPEVQTQRQVARMMASVSLAAQSN